MGHEGYTKGGCCMVQVRVGEGNAPRGAREGVVSLCPVNNNSGPWVCGVGSRHTRPTGWCVFFMSVYVRVCVFVHACVFVYVCVSVFLYMRVFVLYIASTSVSSLRC